MAESLTQSAPAHDAERTKLSLPRNLDPLVLHELHHDGKHGLVRLPACMHACMPVRHDWYSATCTQARLPLQPSWRPTASFSDQTPVFVEARTAATPSLPLRESSSARARVDLLCWDPVLWSNAVLPTTSNEPRRLRVCMSRHASRHFASNKRCDRVASPATRVLPATRRLAIGRTPALLAAERAAYIIAFVVLVHLCVPCVYCIVHIDRRCSPGFIDHSSLPSNGHRPTIRQVPALLTPETAVRLICFVPLRTALTIVVAAATVAATAALMCMTLVHT